MDRNQFEEYLDQLLSPKSKKYKHNKKCSVKGCKNDRQKYSLYCLPKDPNMQIWLKNLEFSEDYGRNVFPIFKIRIHENFDFTRYRMSNC